MKAPPDEKEVAALRKLARDQEAHIVTELSTSLIGIGALFFAYASLNKSPIQPFIALIGLGGSSILWLHCLAANNDRNGAYRVLRERGGSTLSDLTDDASSWRWQGWGRLYVPMTAAATWFMGWVALAWLWILVRSQVAFSLPEWVNLVVVVTVFAVTYLALQHTRLSRRPPEPPGVQPPPQSDAKGNPREA